jgi:thioredoxin-dependent peroxiredoxin
MYCWGILDNKKPGDLSSGASPSLCYDERKSHMTQLQPNDPAPDFEAVDQNGRKVSLSAYSDNLVFIFFYPKANTSGCTTQAKNVRDAMAELKEKGIGVLGISPDLPAQQKKFDDQNELGFPLLSDPDHVIADRYGVWGEKKLYGRTYFGVIRSAFLIDGKTMTIRGAWYKVSPANTVPELRKALASS